MGKKLWPSIIKLVLTIVGVLLASYIIFTFKGAVV